MTMYRVIAVGLVFVSAISAQITVVPGKHRPTDEIDIKMSNIYINFFKPKSPKFARLLEMFALAILKCGHDKTLKQEKNDALKAVKGNLPWVDSLEFEYERACAIDHLLIKKTEGPLPNIEPPIKQLFQKDVVDCLTKELKAAKDYFQFYKRIKDDACGMFSSVARVRALAPPIRPA